jgi:hypothetical protein
MSGARVLATDIAPTSRALSEANAALNGAAVRTARLDWHNARELAAAAAAGPYALVLGASLQFEQWAALGANLWAVLSTLATVGTRVALVHVTGGLQLDAAARRRFRQVERVPGTAFGMTLRGTGGEAYSDFEVVVLEAY